MKRNITKSDSSDSSQPVAETAVYLFDDWFGGESAEAWRTVLGDPGQASATTVVPHRGRGGGTREGN